MEDRDDGREETFAKRVADLVAGAVDVRISKHFAKGVEVTVAKFFANVLKFGAKTADR
jgi:hypothetical protein